MTTATAEQPTTAIAKTTDLPEAVTRRGISEAQWRTLTKNLFPGADPQSVLMVIDYCIARKLDPLKKPCHIVPMRVKDARSGEWGWRDVVMPGIYEYRTTAQRTGEYLGHSKPEYGPMVEHLGVKAPEWCEMTIYRHSRHASHDRIEFPVRRYFAEVVGLTKEGKVNDRWAKAPIQMLEKCTEAAGLREAFPDEFGGEQTAEEMDDQRVVIEAEQVHAPQPAQRKSQQTNGQVATPSTGAPTDRSGDEARSREMPSAAAGAVGGSSAPSHIGLIVDVVERPNGALVKLDTGFQAATKDEAIVRGAIMARDAKLRIELVVKPPRDPKYAAIITEVKPAEAQA
jgi:phage recombination protein Bet